MFKTEKNQEQEPCYEREKLQRWCSFIFAMSPQPWLENVNLVIDRRWSNSWFLFLARMNGHILLFLAPLSQVITQCLAFSFQR